MKWLLNTTVRLVFLLAFVGIAVLGIPAVSNMYNFAPGAVSNIPMLLDGKTPFGVVKYIPVLLQKLLFSASERIGIPVFGQKFDWVAEANVSLSPDIDYDNLEARAKWAVRVYLEMPSRESVTVIRRGAFLLPPYGTLRLTRSSPRE